MSSHGLRGGVLLLGVAMAAAGCTTTRYVSGEAGPQAYYQTSWPQYDTSRQLEDVFRSVKRIQITGFYDTFLFAPEDRITRDALRQRPTYRRARRSFTIDHAKAGTATVIARTERSLRLITNAHVPRMTDTIVAYFDSATYGGRYVESVAILRTQTNIVLDIPGATRFRVITSDMHLDVALLDVEFESGSAPPPSVPVLRVRRGDPARLSWGSFVYVLGYPRGFMMVTRAIVSSPRQPPDNGFILDGLFNRGISGGLVLAVRGETGELEFIGLATSASAQSEQRLVPERRAIDEDGVLLPYRGELYIEEIRRIDYGITFSVPVTAVARFLRTAGYPLLE